MKMRQISSNTTAARTPTVIPSNTGVKFPKMKKFFFYPGFRFVMAIMSRSGEIKNSCKSVRQYSKGMLQLKFMNILNVYLW
jgi:hypothetical protein